MLELDIYKTRLGETELMKAPSPLALKSLILEEEMLTDLTQTKLSPPPLEEIEENMVKLLLSMVKAKEESLAQRIPPAKYAEELRMVIPFIKKGLRVLPVKQKAPPQLSAFQFTKDTLDAVN